MSLQKTLVVWWNYGKEHGGEDFRVNPPDVIAAHLDTKIAEFRARPDGDWNWWQADDSLLIERPNSDGRWWDADTRIYYLINRGLAVIENIRFPPPDDHWKWYIHLADTFYDPARACWLMKDLFCDILVDGGNQQSRVLDLADLGSALDVGLITTVQASEILRRADATLAGIVRGDFPFAEIERGRAACRESGWQ